MSPEVVVSFPEKRNALGSQIPAFGGIPAVVDEARSFSGSKRHLAGFSSGVVPSTRYLRNSRFETQSLFPLTLRPHPLKFSQGSGALPRPFKGSRYGAFRCRWKLPSLCSPGREAFATLPLRRRLAAEDRAEPALWGLGL